LFHDSHARLRLRTAKASGVPGTTATLPFRLELQGDFLNTLKGNGPLDTNGFPAKLPVTLFFNYVNFTTTLAVTFVKKGDIFSASSPAASTSAH
jgi:hypothetical protein